LGCVLADVKRRGSGANAQGNFAVVVAAIEPLELDVEAARDRVERVVGGRVEKGMVKLHKATTLMSTLASGVVAITRHH
jgi:hypothetical protein